MIVFLDFSIWQNRKRFRAPAQADDAISEGDLDYVNKQS